MVQLNGILKENLRGKVTKIVLFLHDNVPPHCAHAVQKKQDYMGFRCLNYPPSSPDLALLNYHLVPGFKNQLKGRHFSADTKVIAAAKRGCTGKVLNFS
jgi:hypothetical protein